MLHGELCWEEQGDQSSWCAGIGACARVCERETPEPGQGGGPINVVP